jgi:perosamine synthetase
MKNLIEYFVKKKKKLKKQFLPLHEPNLTKSDEKEIINGLKTGFVSTAGKDIKRFENKLKNLTKSKFVISTINGTSAIHIGLKVLGVGSDDEVLIPSISFVAAANAIIYNNATPHFVDSEKEHFGIDPIKLDQYLKKNTYIKKNLCFNKKTKRIIRAIIVVHVFGHPAKITEILSIAKKYKIKVLEDAAEALGSLYKNKQVGTFGDIGILSFNGNKIVTTGVGGAIMVKNSYHAKLSRHMITTSKVKHKWEFIHDRVGYNYRLSNLNASLGLSQISKLNKYISHKRKLFKKFKALLKNEKNIKLLNQPKNCRSNFWLHTLVLNKPSKSKKNQLLRKFHNRNIFARPVWKPLHKLKYLKKCPKMNLKNTETLENQIINIPSSYYL